jgi:hypothetical protein
LPSEGGLPWKRYRLIRKRSPPAGGTLGPEKAQAAPPRRSSNSARPGDHRRAKLATSSSCARRNEKIESGAAGCTTYCPSYAAPRIAPAREFDIQLAVGVLRRVAPREKPDDDVGFEAVHAAAELQAVGPVAKAAREAELGRVPASALLA